jgi:hypothetical protein
VGQIATGGTTYQDAEPFKRKVYDNFSGGMGQESDNKTFGGTGIGGDDSKYFYGDCKTDRGGYLLPGMARNMVYNTITGQPVPISDGLDPLGGDEYEIPRGVIPAILGNTAQPSIRSHFTTSAGVTIANVRILIYIRRIASFSDNIVATLTDGANTHIYTLSLALSTAGNYTGWKWVTLPRTSGTGVIAIGHTVTVFIQDTSVPLSDPDLYETAVGCYAVSDATYGSNALMPYFQIMASATPYKYWANPVQKVEQINNGSSTYANIALHSTGLFNLGATATAGTAGTSPERLYTSGTYRSSLWFNSLLYVSTSTGIGAWNYAAAIANAAPTTAIDVAGKLDSMIEWGGKIYGVTSQRFGIWRWDGLFPIVVGTNMVNIVARTPSVRRVIWSTSSLFSRATCG